MSTILAEQRRQLVESFKDKEYRDAFVASRLATGIALKMRATRKARPMTQAELAALSGTKQSVISRFEQRNYGNYSIGSLRKIFAALDVALVVDAIPFSEFIDRLLLLSPDDLTIPTFDEDPGIADLRFEMPVAGSTLPADESTWPSLEWLASVPMFTFQGVFSTSTADTETVPAHGSMLTAPTTPRLDTQDLAPTLTASPEDRAEPRAGIRKVPLAA